MCDEEGTLIAVGDYDGNKKLHPRVVIEPCLATLNDDC